MCWNLTFGHRFDNNIRTARNFWMPPKCFRKYTFRAWIWTQILHYFGGNQECYCPFNMSYWVPRKMDSNYVPMEAHKNVSLTIHSRIRLGNIFPISRDQSSRKKFCAKNTLVASYSRAVIAKKMCWNLKFGHRFDNNIRKARNFWMPPVCFRKYTFWGWIWTQILHVSGWNRESYCPLNMSHKDTRNKDSKIGRAHVWTPVTA